LLVNAVSSSFDSLVNARGLEFRQHGEEDHKVSVRIQYEFSRGASIRLQFPIGIRRVLSG